MNYDPVGFCIYCLAAESTANPLSDEHIVPEGLSGTLVLSKASCKQCADTTGAFERTCQRDLLGSARATWGVYGKRRKKSRPTAFPVLLEDGREENIPLAEFPFSLILPLMMSPALFNGIPIEKADYLDYTDATNYWRWQHPNAIALAQRVLHARRQRVLKVPFVVPVSAFYRMLAKIAHAFVYANRVALAKGRTLHFLLPELILSSAEIRPPGAAYYIGCAPNPPATAPALRYAGDGPHRLQAIEYIGLTADNQEREVIAIHVQLFANVDAPIYEVVVAERI